MLSTPTPETILSDGHISASDTTAFTTCKSAHLNRSLLPRFAKSFISLSACRSTSKGAQW